MCFWISKLKPRLEGVEGDQTNGVESSRRTRRARTHSLSEVLENPNVRGLISETKAASEVKALDEFFEMLANDPARAFMVRRTSWRRTS